MCKYFVKKREQAGSVQAVLKREQVCTDDTGGGRGGDIITKYVLKILRRGQAGNQNPSCLW